MFDHFPRARIGAPLGTAVPTGRDVGVESRHLYPIKTPIQPLVKLLSDCLATHAFHPVIGTPRAANGFTDNSRRVFPSASSARGAAVISWRKPNSPAPAQSPRRKDPRTGTRLLPCAGLPAIPGLLP